MIGKRFFRAVFCTAFALIFAFSSLAFAAPEAEEEYVAEEPASAGAGLSGSFEIQYYLGPSAENMTDLAASYISGAGFTIAPIRGSYKSFWEYSKLENAIKILEKHGLKTYIATGAVSSDMLYNTELATEGVYNQHVKKFLLASNVLGFDLIDEPDVSMMTGKAGEDGMTGVINMVNLLKGWEPEKETYVNLFPSYATKAQLGITEDQTYEKDYLKYFYDNAQVRVLSIDYYPTLKDKTNYEQNERDTYYQNLLMLLRLHQSYLAQGRETVPMNIVGLLEMCIDITKKSHITYQVWTNLAFGMKRLSYFTYINPHEIGDSITWKGGWLVDNSTEPTTMYKWVKDINTWAYNVGNLLYNKNVVAINEMTGSKGKSLLGTSAYLALIGNVKVLKSKNSINKFAGKTSISNTSETGVVTVFDDGTIMLVNGSAETPEVFGLSACNFASLEYYDIYAGTWNRLDFTEEQASDAEYFEKHNGIIFYPYDNSIVMSGGDGVVIRPAAAQAEPEAPEADTENGQTLSIDEIYGTESTSVYGSSAYLDYLGTVYVRKSSAYAENFLSNGNILDDAASGMLTTFDDGSVLLENTGDGPAVFTIFSLAINDMEFYDETFEDWQHIDVSTEQLNDSFYVSYRQGFALHPNFNSIILNPGKSLVIRKRVESAGASGHSETPSDNEEDEEKPVSIDEIFGTETASVYINGDYGNIAGDVYVEMSGDTRAEFSGLESILDVGIYGQVAVYEDSTLRVSNNSGYTAVFVFPDITLSSLDIYDPETKEWKKIEFTEEQLADETFVLYEDNCSIYPHGHAVVLDPDESLKLFLNERPHQKTAPAEAGVEETVDEIMGPDTGNTATPPKDEEPAPAAVNDGVLSIDNVDGSEDISVYGRSNYMAVLGTVYVRESRVPVAEFSSNGDISDIPARGTITAYSDGSVLLANNSDGPAVFTIFSLAINNMDFYNTEEGQWKHLAVTEERLNDSFCVLYYEGIMFYPNFNSIVLDTGGVLLVRPTVTTQ